MSGLLFHLPRVGQMLSIFNHNILAYSEFELRARERFGRASIEKITNLIEADLRRKTKRGYALEPIDQSAARTKILC